MKYKDPTPDELAQIEYDLRSLGVETIDYRPSAEAFNVFQSEGYFPADYHGGRNSGVWDEKLLEHWISTQRLGLMSYGANDIYVDVAAAGSPWAQALRERKQIEAYAIDLGGVVDAYKHLPYYRIENATATRFPNASVKGASLHCAYEMFMGNDDINLLKEIARILKPGGKVIIVPLYMHTHYCAYSTAEYYGKGNSDVFAKEYVCLDQDGIPSARFYDVKELIRRVLKPIERLGMCYQLLALRNKFDFGKNIYCHFVLEVIK